MENTIQDLFPNGFKDYFENTFKRNTMGTLKMPSSVIRNSQKTIEELGEAIAQTYLDVIIRLKYTVLRNVKFSWLLPQDMEALQEALCGAVQHAIVNRNVFERLNASSISTNTFSISEDTTNWLLTKDALGMYAWSTLQSTGIDEYEIVCEDDMDFFIQTNNGNIQILGKYDLEKVEELI